MDGYMKMRGTEQYGPHDESTQGRVAMRWEPNDGFTMDWRIDAGSSRTDDAVPLDLIGCPPGAGYPAPLPPVGAPTNCAKALLTYGSTFDGELNFESPSPYTWSAYDFMESALTNTWSFEKGSLTTITSYFDHEANNRTQLVPVAIPAYTVQGYDPLPSDVLEQYRQFTQEIRYQSDLGGRFEYMYGAYYATSTWNNSSGTGFFFIPFGAILSGPPFNMPTTPDMAFTGLPQVRVEDTTKSAFATATFNVSDDLRINAGARYSSIKKEGTRKLTFGTSVNNVRGTFVPFTNPAFQIGACAILICDNNPFTPGTISDSKFMPSLGAQYDLSDDVMGYVTYTTGFKAGGFSGAATSNTFGPEEVDAYEAGLKGSYLDRRLTMNLAVFRMDYSGLQETAYSQTLASTVLNAAESVSQGVELSLGLRATDGLTLRADIGWLDAHYENFKNAPCTSLGVLTKTCGTPTTGPQDMSGRPRGFAPEWSGSLGATWTGTVAGHQLRIDPSVYFTTDYYINAAADPLLRQGGYAKYDLRIGYGAEDGRWEAALIGKNLGDKPTVGYMLEMPGSPGTALAMPERGRSIALQLSVRN
jgi:outer membrane receptor protein involved in Fe transport